MTAEKRTTPAFAVEPDWLAAWRRHNVRLAMFAGLSIAGAIGLWLASPSPDGRDPFYVAIAIQFAAWSLINLGFVVAGARDLGRLHRLSIDHRSATLSAKRESLARVLRLNNRWLNPMWMLIGVALIVAGYGAWSPSMVGHGLGVVVQAAVLTTFDLGFARRVSASD